jgi:hypothetical protein
VTHRERGGEFLCLCLCLCVREWVWMIPVYVIVEDKATILTHTCILLCVSVPACLCL